MASGNVSAGSGEGVGRGTMTSSQMVVAGGWGEGGIVARVVGRWVGSLVAGVLGTVGVGVGCLDGRWSDDDEGDGDDERWWWWWRRGWAAEVRWMEKQEGRRRSRWVGRDYILSRATTAQDSCSAQMANPPTHPISQFPQFPIFLNFHARARFGQARAAHPFLSFPASAFPPFRGTGACVDHPSVPHLERQLARELWNAERLGLPSRLRRRRTKGRLGSGCGHWPRYTRFVARFAMR